MAHEVPLPFRAVWVQHPYCTSIPTHSGARNTAEERRTCTQTQKSQMAQPFDLDPMPSIHERISIEHQSGGIIALDH